jgi:eukaryotic-like serine/threonine-protein kinase
MEGYNTVKIIGEGGFAIVHKAICHKDGLPYAIKQLKAEYKDDYDIIRRFDREVRIQKALDHPNIVPIFQVEPLDSPPWFVMPKAEYNLEQFLEYEGYGEKNLWLYQEILQAINYAHNHENAAIHRDLKPRNVLIFKRENGEKYAAVSDFGLARFIERDTSPITTSTDRFGTLGYLAPELLLDYGNSTIKADIYSLGKILYVILTGHSPSPIYLNEVPSKFKFIISKATDENPLNRYRNVSEIIDILNLLNKQSDNFIVEEYSHQREIENLLTIDTDDSVEKLVSILFNNINDNKLLINVLPKIHRNSLYKILSNHFTQFKIILKAFDDIIGVDVPGFEYCDKIADLYKSIYESTDDFNIRKIILIRLSILGQEYHRYYVGEVFADIIDGISDESLIMVIYDTFKNNFDVIDFNKEYLREKRLPNILKQMLKL